MQNRACIGLQMQIIDRKYACAANSVAIVMRITNGLEQQLRLHMKLMQLSSSVIHRKCFRATIPKVYSSLCIVPDLYTGLAGLLWAISVCTHIDDSVNDW